jgi:hypothetical protein
MEVFMIYISQINTFHMPFAPSPKISSILKNEEPPAINDGITAPKGGGLAI